MSHTKQFQDALNKWGKASVKELISRQVSIENYVSYREEELEAIKDEGRAIQSLLDRKKPTDA